jgi:hypothetical protein
MFLLVLFHVYVGFEHFYAFNYHITMNYILDLCIGFFLFERKEYPIQNRTRLLCRVS